MKKEIKQQTNKLYDALFGKKREYTKEEWERVKWMYEELGWDKE